MSPPTASRFELRPGEEPFTGTGTDSATRARRAARADRIHEQLQDDAPRKGDAALSKAAARRADRRAAEEHKGYDPAKAADEATGPAARTAARGAIGLGRAGQRAAKRARARAPRELRRARAAAGGGSSTTVTGLLVLALLLVLLYVLLMNGQAVAAFFAGVLAFLGDLMDPTHPAIGGA